MQSTSGAVGVGHGLHATHDPELGTDVNIQISMLTRACSAFTVYALRKLMLNFISTNPENAQTPACTV